MGYSDFPLDVLKSVKTPFYYYDKGLLLQTLRAVDATAGRYGYKIHYAVKANANPEILRLIESFGLGADCVSGGEISAALSAGFPAGKIVYAGVGKNDWEIELALKNGIACFNVESLEELRVIDELAGIHGKIAPVALRINPNVDAHTHEYITTGLDENKFGIELALLDKVLDELPGLRNVMLKGIHFHIGSQILNMDSYAVLCDRINDIQQQFEKRGISLSFINVGGGLGVDYDKPDENPIPDFASYFEVFHTHLHLRKGQEVHFELGRSIVCQCGSLISKVLYVKKGVNKNFVILDAGMTDLIRPALYKAHHKIENITSESLSMERYDVVGPICESSDCFGKEEYLRETKRGDLVAIRSAGAYGEIMASQYNCRSLPGSILL